MSTKMATPGVTGNILTSDTGGALQTESAPFGHALIRAAEKDSRIVGLTADLGKYTDIHVFAEKFPERFFQMGMAEQSLVGAACGLARTGCIPFATTYCVFATQTRLRFYRDRRRARTRKRENHRGPSRPHHRLWRHAPRDRRPRADAQHSRTSR